MKKKISVILPVYNVEKYLNQCLSSLMFQLYNNIEIILIDDGSTDTSFKIFEKYIKKDSRIFLVHKINGGLSSARNIGIKCATGDYVLFLDSDDFWSHENVLSDIFELAKENPDLICYGYREYVDGKGDNGNGIDFSEYHEKGTSKNEVLKELLIHGLYVSSACCKAVKAEIVKQNDLYFKEGITSEDIDWSARLLKCIKSISVYPNSFYCYRQRKESIVHNIKYENLEMLSDNILRCVELGKDINPSEFRDLYYNYVAYQYITFLKVALLCEDDRRTKALLTKMKSYGWLLDFHLNRKVKIVYRFKKLLGFNLMYKILKVYAKG